jgi:phosphoribosyl-AMP cyclohydrolase
VTESLDTGILDRVRFDERGLVPVVAQAEDGGVLMLAWANREALEATLRTRRGTYWSRSRRELWRKGDTSGHVQEVLDVRLDCDGDAVLYLVRQTGPACHLGKRSCFDPP